VDKKMLNSETSLCKSSMDALKEDLKAVDKKIQQLIDNDTQLKELFDIAECRPVDSVKGIVPVIATEVLITTNEFKDITDPKKYACGWRSTYSGFAPFEHSSGKYKGKSKVSNKANKKVKALFHNGAMSAIQHCKELKECHQRKVSEGKNEMLVINNVCNKLVHRIFACVSRREKYNENYIQSFA
jgi:transposase